MDAAGAGSRALCRAMRLGGHAHARPDAAGAPPPRGAVRQWGRMPPCEPLTPHGNEATHHNSCCPNPRLRHPPSAGAQISKLKAGDTTPDVMLGRQTLLNCAAFHKMGNGCDGAGPRESRMPMRMRA